MTSPFEVLVISSDLALRRQLANVLTALGVDPVCISTLRECHEILAEKRVGLVFCDHHVADGSYQDLLSRYSLASDRPRVVVTSRTANWDEYKEAMECGAFDLVSVPCRNTDVEWMVIQAKRAERQPQAPGLMRAEHRAAAKATSASASAVNTLGHHVR